MRDALVSNLPARAIFALGIEAVAIIASVVYHYEHWRWISVATVAVLFGAYRSWRIGLAFTAFALLWASLDAALTTLFFGYRFEEIIFMKRLWTGSIAFPYGVALSGIVSAAWGALAGDLVTETARRRGAPFTTDTLTPDHVMQLSGDDKAMH